MNTEITRMLMAVMYLMRNRGMDRMPLELVLATVESCGGTYESYQNLARLAERCGGLTANGDGYAYRGKNFDEILVEVDRLMAKPAPNLTVVK